MRRTSLVLLGAAAGAGLVLLAAQPRVVLGTSANAASTETYRQLNLFGDVFERIRSDYVEKPDDGKLIESAINGMLSSLDPHSSYMDAKNFRDMQVQTRGEFGGLGIEVRMEDGALKVITPIDDTPAAKAGVLPEDTITHLDDQPVEGLSLNDAVEKMRGAVNTKIRLRVLRRGVDGPMEIVIVRDVIRVRSVRSRSEGGDIAYVRIATFNEQTTEGLQKAIRDLTAQIGADKLKGFILDLRNNPGGLLTESVSVSDTFLEKGEIVSTRGRQADETQRFNARAGDLTNGKPVIVLINGGSASASEIVAGALQDQKRATVIGSRSFGKGSVQTIIPLGSGTGALRLTTARYYTPSGRSIQAKGIVPDIEVLQDQPDDPRDRQDTRGEANLRGHLRGDGDEQTGSQSFIPPDPKADKALNFALARLRGVEIAPPLPQAAGPAAAVPPPAPALPAPIAVAALSAEDQQLIKLARAVQGEQAELRACQTKLDGVLAAEPVSFESGAVVIEGRSRDTVDKVAEAFARCATGLRLEVRGMADARGAAGTNFALSERRAASVVRRLTEAEPALNGRVLIVPLGAVGSAGSDDDLQRNRRVEFRVLR
jgi:carboxyl-terminal processing protease